MSLDKSPIIDADKIEDTQPSPETAQHKDKKKSNFKLHLILTLVLGVGTWAFITYSQTAKDWQQQWYDFTHQTKPVIMTEPVAQQPETTAEVQPEPTPEPQTVELTPVFENVDTATKQPIASQDQTLNIEELSDITVSIQDMSAQINLLQQTVSQLQDRQLHWSQQQVRAQLFTLLQQAASPQANIQSALLAWKSISFLPLLSPEKRDTANEAYDALLTLQQDMQKTENNIQSLMTTLAEQLHPQALEEIAQSVKGLTDPYQQADTFYSWLDWIQQQFIISKVDEHALDISDDPFAELKQLIQDLDALNQSIQHTQWQHIQSLTSLFYRLEQRGLEADFSRETITHFEQETLKWQQEARLWMAQL